MCCDPLAAEGDRPALDLGDRSVQPDLDAEFLKRALRVVRETVRIAVQDLWPRLDEQHARLARIDGAEVPRQRIARQVGDRPGQFDAGRTAADDHEGEQRLEPRRVGFALGFLERQKDAAADRGGVFDRLQPGRRRLPVVMAEIAVARPRREDQRVVGNRASNREAHHAGRRIHAHHRRRGWS